MMQLQLFEAPERLHLDWPGQLAREATARRRRAELRALHVVDVEARARRAERAIVASSIVLEDHARRALQVLAPEDIFDPLWRAVFGVVAICHGAGVPCSIPMVRVALAHDYGILLFDHGARIEACAIGAWLARDEIDIERYARLVRAARLKREQKQDIGKTLEATG